MGNQTRIVGFNSSKTAKGLDDELCTCLFIEKQIGDGRWWMSDDMSLNKQKNGE